MNKSKVIILLVVLNLLLVGICLNSDNKNILVNNEKQIVKEMTVGEYEGKITELNKSHADYALQVQENKKKLATAISNQNVTTSENASIDEMVTNIEKILQNSTSDATATEEDIVEGKTAYVNGQLLIGESAVSNNCDYEIILKITHSVFSYNTPGDVKTISENVTITIIDGVVTCPSSFYFDTNRKSGVSDVAGWVTPRINSISVVSITKL